MNEEGILENLTQQIRLINSQEGEESKHGGIPEYKCPVSINKKSIQLINYQNQLLNLCFEFTAEEECTITVILFAYKSENYGENRLSYYPICSNYPMIQLIFSKGSDQQFPRQILPIYINTQLNNLLKSTFVVPVTIIIVCSLPGPNTAKIIQNRKYYY